jgi:hypothetical protein
VFLVFEINTVFETEVIARTVTTKYYGTMSYRINILINYNPIPVVKAKTDRYSKNFNSAFSEKFPNFDTL